MLIIGHGTWVIIYWGYRREIGEPQVTFNYTKAFADFINNFTYGRGVTFRSPPETEAITPYLLNRVWETDNDKMRLLWEMGNQSGVSGDCFVKVAYEEPWVDPIGRNHLGKVRILPLNSSHCFPEWHPHDRSRLLRFKLKYRFWGCHRTDVQALTRRGWLHHSEILESDELLTLDPSTDEIQWSPHQGVHVYDYDGEMLEWRGRVDASATPNHRWLGELPSGERRTIHGEFVAETPTKTRLVVGGGTPLEFRQEPKWADELVESVAWYVCDGSDHVNQQGFRSIHLSGKKPHKVAAWRRLASWWTTEGATWREGKTTKSGQTPFYIGKGAVPALHEAAPGKRITPEFLCSLTYSQARLFRRTLVEADGHERRGSIRWTQLNEARRDGYQMLCAMLGVRTSIEGSGEKVQEYASRYIGSRHLNETREYHKGQVWCPTVPTGFFMARRNGKTYWTGNTAAEGTRQVFSYTELMTEDSIQEFVNDELLDSRPNPLGTIPVVQIANVEVSGSPWGLSDIGDITALNREFNEKATDISDIINYHAAPVTVITGAKASQLEKGPKKVWGGLPKEAQVFNLELGGNLAAPLEYLELLKRSMHEMTGVPETALGKIQPISNTSGVALAIQYQPMMHRYNLKKIQATAGLKRINELVMLTLAVKEPQAFLWDPRSHGVDLQPGQMPQLDPSDPLTYQSSVHWPPPLPTDVLVKLNEIQAKMSLGLESKKGALRDLDEEFPDEKMRELFEELVEDAKEQGALDLMRSQIASSIMMLTGVMPGADGPEVPSAGGSDVSSAGGETGALPGIGTTAQDQMAMMSDLVTRAYGTKMQARRTNEGDPN